MPAVYIIDQVVHRYGLMSILREYPEFQLVGEETNTEEVLDKIEELKPEIIILLCSQAVS